jgi:tetratricopeptide (TPR) repeat protein
VLERAVSLQRDDSHPNPHTLHGLGDVALESGDLDAAAEWYSEAMRIAADADLHFALVHCLAGLAAVEAQRGDLDSAATLWAATLALLEEHGIGLEVRERYESRLDLLDRSRFEARVEEERRRGLEELLSATLRQAPID